MVKNTIMQVGKGKKWRKLRSLFTLEERPLK